MRRPGVCVVLTLALALAAAAASEASACDASRRSAASAPHHGRAPLIIGDSTMIFAAPYLGRHGFQADAHGCRQFGEGVSMLAARKRAGTLPRLSILALGANGPVSSATIAGALRILGPSRVLGLVTPRKSGYSETSMRRAARRHPDRVLLIDWVGYSSPHGGWFGGDGLHVNDAGAHGFADFVRRRGTAFFPPAKPLRVPRGSRGTKPCGTIRRFGRVLRVHVARGERRILCRRAREIARRPPLLQLRGWRIYDWRDARPGPWADIYARQDRRVLVGTVAVRRARGSATAATRRETYHAIDADGTLRDGLSVHLGAGRADCATGSYKVAEAFRCFDDDLIRDPCYPDTRDEDVTAVLCVASPWSRAATRLEVGDALPEPSASATTPWSLELASGARCGFVGGATAVVGGYRLNYGCDRGRRPYLFGTPDRRSSTWRIRAARDPQGRGLRKLAIRKAWR